MIKTRYILIVIILFLAVNLCKSIDRITFTTPKTTLSEEFHLNGTIFDVINLEQELFFIKQNADTVAGINKITKLWSAAGNIYIKLLISKSETAPIQLSLFNLLGKEVKIIYNGAKREEDFTYSANINDLPNGVYICVLTSNNYRDAKKFVISK